MMNRGKFAVRWRWGMSVSICQAVTLGVSLLWLSSVNLAQEDLTPSELPRLDFVQGSVEEACGLNSFPRYSTLYRFEHYDWGEERWNATRKNDVWVAGIVEDWKRLEVDWNALEVELEVDWRALEGEDCQIALDKHIDSTNPYLWGGDASVLPNFAFVKLEEPPTFGRIFADPTDDFSRVRDVMMNRDECLLRGEETNWDLKDACSASAIFNYAFINHFCFSVGTIDHYRRARSYYMSEEDPTPEQDRSMWKQDLEDAWVRERCEEVPSYLDLDSEHNTELYSMVTTLGTPETKYRVLQNLIELSARLGDEAAGLTGRLELYTFFYDEVGAAKYGRFATLLTSEEYRAFAFKSVPSTDRFLKTFHMLDFVLTHHTKYPDEIDFDWEFVVRHLCEPPFDFTIPSGKILTVTHQEYPSCKDVAQEIREREALLPEISDILDNIEKIARSVGVYD